MKIDLQRPRVCPKCGSYEHVEDEKSPRGWTGSMGRHRLGDPYVTRYRCLADNTHWAVYYSGSGERRVEEEPYVPEAKPGLRF